MSSMLHTQQKQHQGTTSTPQRPWEKVGADLFEIYNKHYLILVDYYFRFIEIEIQCETTSDKVIECCMSQFARYGIPDVAQTTVCNSQVNCLETLQTYTSSNTTPAAHTTHSLMAVQKKQYKPSKA